MRAVEIRTKLTGYRKTTYWVHDDDYDVDDNLYNIEQDCELVLWEDDITSEDIVDYEEIEVNPITGEEITYEEKQNV